MVGDDEVLFVVCLVDTVERVSSGFGWELMFGLVQKILILCFFVMGFGFCSFIIDVSLDFFCFDGF